MSVAAPSMFRFDNTFARELAPLYQPWQATTAPDPQLLVLNEQLAAELCVDPAELRTPEGVAVLVGNAVPEGAEPLAQAYAGHQFGGYSPRLGDGRALLLGEIVDEHGRRRDLQLKGSGRTPFARGGDGLAAVGPMLREYVIGEAMHALGIPTTRALAVVATGGEVARETMLPGAVLSRVAASHLRVGTFEYASANGGPELVRLLADYAIERHHPAAAQADNPYLSLLEHVMDAQAALVARWMAVGFIHGVMNTDNVTISGETIDYGPCAFMDAYDPGTVFSSIDHGGRYAYGNQPTITLWNLARLAESMLALLGPDTDTAVRDATELLESFPGRYQDHWLAGMCAKLGLDTAAGGDAGAGTEVDHDLVVDLLGLLGEHRVDFTGAMRSLSAAVRGDEAELRSLFPAPAAIDGWVARWADRRSVLGADPATTAARMDRVNPRYIPRNHLVEAALAAASEGDLAPFRELVEVVTSPFDDQPGRDAYALAAPSDFGPYRTFCGT
jgi:uncharacterized protein YdiU (UPF0061 family)